MRDLRPFLEDLRDSLGVSGGTGFIATREPTVKLFWSETALPRVPLSYDPGIAIIVSGRKIGFLDTRQFTYDAGQYLAVGLPVCFDCETQATPADPLIGMFISAENAVLQDLAAGISEKRVTALPKGVTLGVEPLNMSQAMTDAVVRLATQLADPTEAELLARGTIREVFFHALKDPHGNALLAMTRPDRPEVRMASALRRLEAEPSRSQSVAEMAALAGMSPASFHRHFRAAFGTSPKRYLKQRRLMRARRLLIEDGLTVSGAAQVLGYSSPAQFSKDFRQAFDVPPSKAHLLGFSGVTVS